MNYYLGSLKVVYLTPFSVVAERETQNVVRFPGLLETDMVPPCSSTIRLDIASPNPVPLDFVLKKGLKMSSIIFVSIP